MDDVRPWAGQIPEDALWVAPGRAATAGFHLRHLAESTRRPLAYAWGDALTEAQRAALAREREPGVDGERDAFRATPPDSLLEPREVGREEGARRRRQNGRPDQRRSSA